MQKFFTSLMKLMPSIPGFVTEYSFWRRFGIMLLMSCVAYFSLFISPLLIYDDASRIYTHSTINQGVHGRPLADVAYAIFSCGQFMDFSPLSQIWALAFLLVAGALVADMFTRFHETNKSSWLSDWSPLFFTLQPLFFAIISFRFDSFTISLGLLCAAASFYCSFSGKGLGSVVGSGLFILMTLCLYQPALGVFFACGACWLACLALRATPHIQIYCILRALLSCALAGVAYLPIYLHALKNANSAFNGLPMHPHAATHINVTRHLGEFLNSIGAFGRELWIYCGPNPVFICLCAIAAGAVLAVLLSSSSWPRKMLALFFMICALFSCGLILVALSNSIFPPRTMLALCALVLSLLLMAATLGGKWIYRWTATACVCCMIFSASTISMFGNAERDQHEMEQQMVFKPLWRDIISWLEKEKDPAKFTYCVAGNEIPHHYNIKTLGHFLPLGTQTWADFATYRLMSWLPLKYNLALSKNCPPLDKCELLSRHAGYEIYLYKGDALIIRFLDFPATRFVAPFEAGSEP